MDRGAKFGENVELSSGKAITENNGGTFNLVYDTPTAQVYTGEMDEITGVSQKIE